MSDRPEAPAAEPAADPAPVLAAARRAGVELHPDAVRFLAAKQGAPPLDTQSAEQNRQGLTMALPLTGTGADLPSVTDTVVPGPVGDVPVRVYRPSTDPGLPAVLYAHGGGWVQGDLEVSDSTCRDLAAASGAVVVSVHYRRPPEQPFPAAFDDYLAVARHLLAGGHGVDGSRVALSGDSAGGNLAAAVALHLRGHDPEPVHQVLVYPVITLAVGESASYERFAEGFSLTRRDMAYFADQYAAGADRDDPRLSPGACTDLTGAPPATVILAEADPLHDEGVAYAERLTQAGVDVELRVWPGQVHPFVALGAAMGDAHEARAYAGARLRAAFALPPRE